MAESRRMVKGPGGEAVPEPIHDSDARESAAWESAPWEKSDAAFGDDVAGEIPSSAAEASGGAALDDPENVVRVRNAATNDAPALEDQLGFEPYVTALADFLLDEAPFSLRSDQSLRSLDDGELPRSLWRVRLQRHSL